MNREQRRKLERTAVSAATLKRVVDDESKKSAKSIIKAYTGAITKVLLDKGLEKEFVFDTLHDITGTFNAINEKVIPMPDVDKLLEDA